MAYVIATWNEKGGTGKSTTSLNLAAALAERGNRVLLVDLDPSYSITLMLGNKPEQFARGVHHFFLSTNPVAVQEATYQVPGIKNLFLVPGHEDLEVALARKGEERWADILTEALADVQQAVDFVVIDCPPGMGFFPMNALGAADLLLIPVLTELPSLEALPKMGRIFHSIPEERRPSDLLILPTMYDGRRNHDREVVDELRKRYPGNCSGSLIPRTVRVPDSVTVRKPIIHYDPEHEASKGYRALGEEVLTLWRSRSEHP